MKKCKLRSLHQPSTGTLLFKAMLCQSKGESWLQQFSIKLCIATMSGIIASHKPQYKTCEIFKMTWTRFEGKEQIKLEKVKITIMEERKKRVNSISTIHQTSNIKPWSHLYLHTQTYNGSKGAFSDIHTLPKTWNAMTSYIHLLSSKPCQRNSCNIHTQFTFLFFFPRKQSLCDLRCNYTTLPQFCWGGLMNVLL